MTEKIFKKNPYLKEYTSTVTALEKVESDSDLMDVVLESTIFFPTGGGQPCDLGTINGFPVLDVRESSDQVIHRISLAEGGSLNVGDSAHLILDWDRRFLHMQRHLGEHILSGAFYNLFGGVNKGFHMGEDYMTIDIDMENAADIDMKNAADIDMENAAGKELTEEMILKAERAANEVIWNDLPVTTKYFSSPEEAADIPLRKDLTVAEDISVVIVGDVNSPADAVACCGTHPDTAGQVGLIKIYKHEPNKGMTRIYFDAGKAAFDVTNTTFHLMEGLQKEYSAGLKDFPEKYKVRQEKINLMRTRLHELTEEIKRREALELAEMLGESAWVAKEYKLLTPDDLIAIGRSLGGSVPGLLFLICLSQGEATVFIFSDSQDCGKLVKDNVAVFNGKGGGNKTFARAIFKRKEDMETFMDAIRKISGLG